jgi:hypothetical protein
LQVRRGFKRNLDGKLDVLEALREDVLADQRREPKQSPDEVLESLSGSLGRGEGISDRLGRARQLDKGEDGEDPTTIDLEGVGVVGSSEEGLSIGRAGNLGEEARGLVRQVVQSLESSLAREAYKDREGQREEDRRVDGFLARLGSELVEKEQEDGSKEIGSLESLDEVREEPVKV